MRVAILHGSNDLYGASRLLVSEVHALRGLGHEVHVVLPSSGPLTAQLVERGASVAVDRSLAVLRASRLRDVARPPRLPRSVRSTDVVILWTLALSVYIPLLVLSRRAFVISVHELRPNRLSDYLVRLLLAPGRFPVEAVSEAVAEWLRINGVRRDRVHVAYPVVEPLRASETRKDERTFTVAVAARLNGRKGHLEVLRAFREAAAGREGWKLVLAGGSFGEDTSQRELLAAEVGADEDIRLLGEVRSLGELEPRPDLFACFGDRPEAFGLVPLEAWSIGVRSAAFDEGGAAEVLPLLGGILVPRSDHEIRDIAAALVTASSECKTWNRTGSSEVEQRFGADARRAVVQSVLATASTRGVLTRSTDV